MSAHHEYDDKINYVRLSYISEMTPFALSTATGRTAANKRVPTIPKATVHPMQYSVEGSLGCPETDDKK